MIDGRWKQDLLRAPLSQPQINKLSELHAEPGYYTQNAS